MRVRCFSTNAPRVPGTEFSLREGVGDLYGPRFQPTRPSASRERILQLCDRSVPLQGVKKNGGGTEG